MLYITPSASLSIVIPRNRIDSTESSLYFNRLLFIHPEVYVSWINHGFWWGIFFFSFFFLFFFLFFFKGSHWLWRTLNIKSECLNIILGVVLLDSISVVASPLRRARRAPRCFKVANDFYTGDRRGLEGFWKDFQGSWWAVEDLVKNTFQFYGRHYEYCW